MNECNKVLFSVSNKVEQMVVVELGKIIHRYELEITMAG